jgi:hypothetical protein
MLEVRSEKKGSEKKAERLDSCNCFSGILVLGGGAQGVETVRGELELYSWHWLYLYL